MSHDYGLYSAYASLLLQALLPIAIGSFKSLKTPASTLARRKALRKQSQILTEDPSDEDEEEEDQLEETLTWADSLWFPIFGSCALLSLWLVLKYVGKEWINLILGVYFSGAGVFAVQSTLSSIVTWSLRQTKLSTPTYHIRITSNLRQIFHLPISLPSLILLPASIACGALYIPLGRPWILSNVLALCLGTATLALLRLDSFPTAFLLLGLLLVYDIFWVFATPVMVTVAKGIDAPIKILAPRSVSSTDFAMLGLGDIVIPGMVIALCLRFDLARHAKRFPQADVTARSRFAKPYFWVGMASYVVGLGTTMAVMHWRQKAQPALLYLSPACSLGPILLALSRGELKTLMSHSETPADGETKRDETIEAPSEVARRAREAVQLGKEEQVAQGVVDHVVDEVTKKAGSGEEEEDTSWMDGPADGGDNGGGKARRRKGGKKK